MRVLLLVFMLTGCTTGNWADYNYGPGDWLNENTPLQVETMYNYAHLVEPTIEVHYVESVAEYCGSIWAEGCAALVNGHCDIYLSKNASPGTMAHEQRHCRGWTHHQPKYEMFSAMGAEFRAREVALASVWVPMEQPALAIAMAQPRRY